MKLSLLLKVCEKQRDPDVGDRYGIKVVAEDSLDFDCGIPANPRTHYVPNGLPGRLSQIRLEERTLLGAELTVPEEWEDESFELQVGCDPDGRMSFSNKSFKNGVMFGVLKRRDSEILFDTMGPTHLYLIHKESRRRVLDIRVRIEPSPEREEVMRAVVGELIDLAPQTLSSKHEWQNESSYRDRWSRGSTSFAFPDLELDAVCVLLEKMQMELLAISRAPASRIGQFAELKTLGRSRKLSRRGQRQISSQYGNVDIHQLATVRVESIRRVCTYDIEAHRTLWAFLKKLDRRLVDIKQIVWSQGERFDGELSRANELLENIQDEDRKSEFAYEYGFRIKSLKGRKNDAEESCRKICRARGRIACLLSLEIFKDCNRSEKTFCLKASGFSFNGHYQRLFRLVSDYERTHHWWRPLNDRWGLTHTKELLEPGKYGNELQRKYSMLFEYWSCWRLIAAFERLNVNFEVAREKLRVCLSRSFVVDDEFESFVPIGYMSGDMSLEISLVHNYAAYDPSVNASAPFKTTLRDTTLLRGKLSSLKKFPSEQQLYETPDMAIIIRNPILNKWFWVTMDAKSTCLLRSEQIIKQWRYLRQLHTPSFDQESSRYPLSSWLVYAGRVDGVSGLEFVEGEDVSHRCWHVDHADSIKGIVDAENDPQTRCNISDGLVRNEKSDRRFMGEIRVNPVTAPFDLDNKSKDPFLQFAQIQLATARRILA